MRRRLILGFVAVATLLVVALAVPLGILFARNVRAAAVDAAEDDATQAASAFEQALDQQTTIVAPMLEDIDITLVDATGGVLAGPAPRAAVVDALENLLRVPPGRPVEVREAGYLTVIAVAGGDDAVGAAVVTRTTDETERTVRAGWVMLTVIGVLVLAVSVGVAQQLATWIADPLDDLRAATSAFGTVDLQQRVDDARWPEELRTLGNAFNAMANRIEQLVAHNEEFVHEASHQLRTPLTGLRLRMENLAAEADEPLAEQLSAATEEIDRLSRMTGGLLALARAERRGGEPRPVALVDFVNEWARQWQPLCDEYGIELALELAPVPAALADPDRLSQVIDNLVANALDASEGGTVITIATSTGPDSAVEVRITDQGRGMSADQRQRAFDRFWRAGPPGSEARLGGTGLGLPIAARLVAHDGGTIRLEAGSDGRGTVAVVSLPRA